ncbi:MAG: type 4a pilus biogenesis protein PilO [Vicinamibacterales bacterium]
MKALFTVGASVPVARVVRDHRKWLWPLGVVIAINLGVLGLVVLPLAASVESVGRRAEAAAQSLKEAKADFAGAEATRDGQSQATRDLDRFYRQVLPADAAAARRLTHLRLSQKAREHNLTFERSSAQPESLRDSELERLRVSYALAGNYDDVRQLIYDIETGEEFVVIDNIVLAEGSDNNAPLKFNLELSTYYRTGHHDR